MKGYKAFNSDLTCRGFQYKIGETYEMNESPICCKNGFHFCKNISDVYCFYDMSDDTRICEVQAIGKVVTDDNIKFTTNKIKILREIKSKSIKHCNLDKTDVGYCNSGNKNSGNRNSGNKNSGDYNSGDCNSGNSNSGDCNSGDCNSGNRNSGNSNSGNRNCGYCNSGDYNSGDWNSGNWNSGDWNSGDWNSGDWNSGYRNSGYRNSGDCNSGNSNSGNWNSGNSNSGVFNTCKNPKIKMFDEDSDWTIDDWLNSQANSILLGCPYSHSDFIPEQYMTDEEKENHPDYKTIGGYIKIVIATKEDKQKWWNDLSQEKKDCIFKLPNFDSDKFVECLGIEHI